MLQANALNFNKKDLIDAYFMRGQCLNELFRFKDALISFDKVIEIQPEYALVNIKLEKINIYFRLMSLKIILF